MESINRSKAHDYAYEIEIILRRVFAHKYAYNHELFNFINADLIEYDPVIAITFTLGYLSNGASNQLQEKILKFSDRLWCYYGKKSIGDILSFESDSKSNGIDTEWIDRENGYAAIEDIEKELSDIIEYAKQCNILEEY